MINLQAVADDRGVYFGTWGVLRRDPTQTCDAWKKSDGRYYGLALEKQASSAAQELWAPLEPSHTPTGYLWPGRPKLGRDIFWCGLGNEFLVSFYNGTVEGTPVIDPIDRTHYVGRGDGSLYAIDAVRGTVVWRFETFNPEHPGDPDGGGEVIGGPVMDPGGSLYIATVAAPWPGTPDDPAYETNAVYAVDRDGQLQWRYPSTDASLENWLLAAPALSPDATTLYVGTWAGDATRPGRLLALDLTAPPSASDAERLRWDLELVNAARAATPSVWVRSLSVGPEGRIWLAGAEAQFLGSAPVVASVTEAGRFAWDPAFVELDGFPSTDAQFTAGLALWEAGGVCERVWASTSLLRGVFGTQEGGTLSVLDAVTGEILERFDPRDLPLPGTGGMTAPTLDNEEVCYVGVRGQHHPGDPEQFVDGKMYALQFDANTGSIEVLWQRPVDGNLDWVPPVIGANGGLYFGSSDRAPILEDATWYGLSEQPANRDPVFSAVFE